MKERLEGERYDTRLWMSDWRSSASVLGLIRYFKYLKHKNIDVSCSYIDDEESMKSDYLDYNSSDITRERYLEFAEKDYVEDMHHRGIEDYVDNYNGVELSKDYEDVLKKKLQGNTIMKKVFKGVKVEDRGKIKEILSDREKRLEIIENTFRNGVSQYRNYCNTNAMLTDEGKSCRLVGYSVDMGKKGKSAGYMQDANAFNYSDFLEYDFIPFAFTKTRESFFVNNNYNLRTLVNSYEKLRDTLEYKKEDEEAKKKRKRVRSALFEYTGESSSFIEADVEVIKKDRDKDYYESIYVRDESIEIFKKVKDRYKGIQFVVKITDKYYIQVEHQIVDSILNLQKIDELIEQLMKKEYLNETMIRINQYIYEALDEECKRIRGGELMSDMIDKAKNTGYAVRLSMNKKPNGKQKVKSFKNKLISAISFRDYDAFNLTLMKLSDYSGIVFDFAYDLFDDFEKNKNLAYAFINALNESKDNK